MRPKISLENHAEVYDYYSSHTPGKYSAKLLHGLMGAALKPTVIFESGAEEKITTHLNSGKTIVLASNHLKAIDPCVIAALPSNTEAFESLAGNSFIPSKEPIQATPVIRRIVDGLGAVPVFRAEEQKTPESAQTKSQLTAAARGLLKMSINKMDQGQNMVIFPEGTRNEVDATKLQDLKKGLGLMVCKVTGVEQPAIVPMALRYEDDIRKPIVYVGNPTQAPFENSRQVSAALPALLQECIDQSLLIN